MQEIGSLLNIFTSKLNQLDCEYMVTGSVASMHYGEPRFTHDIDLVFSIKNQNLKSFENIFPLDDFYFPPLEVIQLEINRSLRGHFNIIHNETGFKADIYTLGNDPLLKWGLLNKQKVEFDNCLLYVAPPEYVIIQKMNYWEEGKSEKHIRDISAMIDTLEDNLKLDLIKSRLSSDVQKNKLEYIINEVINSKN